MQVFITNKDLKISAMELDDVRLSKQITEINQILLCYINELTVDKVGHQNHPINIHYKSKQGVKTLIDYEYRLCVEYKFRFNKYHMGYFTLDGILGAIKINDYYDWEDNKDFNVAYIKGQKGVNQIIDKDNPYELYKTLLSNKWDNDIKPPKWTNREIPIWYKRKDSDYEK